MPDKFRLKNYSFHRISQKSHTVQPLCVTLHIKALFFLFNMYRFRWNLKCNCTPTSLAASILNWSRAALAWGTTELFFDISFTPLHIQFAFALLLLQAFRGLLMLIFWLFWKFWNCMLQVTDTAILTILTAFGNKFYLPYHFCFLKNITNTYRKNIFICIVVPKYITHYDTFKQKVSVFYQKIVRHPIKGISHLYGYWFLSLATSAI